VTPLLAGGLPWSDSLRGFLNEIATDYVLLLLEDFFLCAQVRTSRFFEHLNALGKLDGKVLRLHPNPRPTISVRGFKTIGEQHRLAPFRVSLQASIWNKQALMDLLRDGESPWEFELNGTIRSQTQPRGLYCTWKTEFPYQQVVERGKWFWSAARHFQKLDIGCDFSAREVMDPITAARKVVVESLRRWRGQLLTLPLGLREIDPYANPDRGLKLRVAFLTNLIPPYHKPVLHLLTRRYADMRVFISTPMEANRQWKVDWGDLDVVVQKTYTAKGMWHHPRGFSEPLAIHVPLDTLGQLQRFSPDVVISAEMGARTLLAIVHRKLNPHTRLIIWAEAAESTESGRGLVRQIARKIFVKQADAFLAVGTSAVKYLEQIGAPSQKIFKIAYTTDVSRFAVSPLTRPPSSARRLLFCGQLVERKGLIPFLQVLTRWANGHPACNIEFVLAGAGPLHAELTQLQLPANVKLEFLGALQYEDLPEIYGSAGIFVLPTLADTWAVVVNEALASGLPVLGSAYAQAVEELIQDGYNGWVFRPGEGDEAYRAFDRMMSTSTSQLDAMRAHGRAVALELSPERVADLIGAAIRCCASA